MSDVADASKAPASEIGGKITCLICGAHTHTIAQHLKKEHEGISLEQYQADYPDAPILSDFAKAEIARRQAKETAENTVNDMNGFSDEEAHA